MTTVIHNIEDHGIWRGHHSWTVVMEDEHGRSQVSARGDTAAEAEADARKTFGNRRIWTPEEREAMARTNRALRRGLS